MRFHFYFSLIIHSQSVSYVVEKRIEMKDHRVEKTLYYVERRGLIFSEITVIRQNYTDIYGYYLFNSLDDIIISVLKYFSKKKELLGNRK